VPDSFGARLRQKREEQQIALAAIAADTKIKLSLLEALERDDLSGWPAGIFRRGYVRAYARAIGLQPDAVVSEFVALYPEPDDSETPLSAGLPKSAEPDSWRERIWQFGRRTLQPDVIASNTSTFAKRPDPAAVSTPPPDREAMATPTAAVDTASSADETELRPAEEPPAPPAIDTQETFTFEPDLSAAARLCTDLGRVGDCNDLVRVLEAAAKLLNGSGLIIWIWDERANALVPAFTHGYAERVLARLQPIAGDSDNPTANAFRSAEMVTVRRNDRQNGALVAPLMRSEGCIGVFAIEVNDGVEEMAVAGHLVRIVAAQLATLFDVPVAGAATGEPASDERATREA